MQKKLNLKIKFREGFRPFAPAVLAENVSEYFELDKPSPYMLLVSEIKKNRQFSLPHNYDQQGMNEKLLFLRSDLPAVTHVDYTARIQTVDKKTNLRFWQLLQQFKKLTGYAVLVNTSFNVRGEPIVNSPEDAYRCFMQTDMDYLVMSNFFLSKSLQPEWNDKKKDTKNKAVPD
jgi:carbamoyltransferase